MINPKNICVSGCIGFFLSFFIGLASDVRFSHVLLRAFLFALLFALLCVAVSFIYQKFLSPDNGGFVETDSSVKNNPASTGSVINIVVDDSNLPDDELSPKFHVVNKLESMEPVPAPKTQQTPETKPPEQAPQVQAVSEAPAEGEKPEEQAEKTSQGSPASQGFTPMGLQNVAGNGNEEPQEASDGKTESLDELPDMAAMDSFSTDTEENGSDFGENSASEIVDDTEFSTGGARLKEQPISGDTNVMAKAIQTLLAKDDS